MQNSTTSAKPNIEKKWCFIDATDKILGKVAEEASVVLIGKDNPEYAPNQNMGGVVVITNAEKIKVTGGKMDKKIYYHYTGFPGGLREQKLKDVYAKDPTKILEKAINGMLPKNRLRSERMNNLHIYKGSEHPHKAQEGKK